MATAIAAAASRLRLLKRSFSAIKLIYSGRISSPVSDFIGSNFIASVSHSSDIFVNHKNQALHIRRFGSDANLQVPAPFGVTGRWYHQLADSTVQDLLEKSEEYGDSIQIDGFNIDYGNQVLTLKLGSDGTYTYVLNKQTPNRQLWLSSPVSGPSRFDWYADSQAWIYRRTKANLYRLFVTELEQLCGSSINLA